MSQKEPIGMTRVFVKMNYFADNLYLNIAEIEICFAITGERVYIFDTCYPCLTENSFFCVMYEEKQANTTVA